MADDSPILIIGGTGGIGFALAKRLVAAGRPVRLIARDGERLAAASGALGNVPSAAADATDPPALAAAIARLSGDGLAGLAYAVGSIVLKPLKRATAEDFLDAFRLNALGAALAVQAAEAPLRAAKGSIVLFSTVAAGAGFPNHAVIAAAKGAVEALTRSLAADLAPDVRVNCIAPSLTRTPLAQAITGNDSVARSIAALHPLPRLGDPEDIAATAAFLLSPDAGWITGQVIAVDGGRGRVRSKG